MEENEFLVKLAKFSELFSSNEFTSKTITLKVNDETYDKYFNYFQEKFERIMFRPKNKFLVKIGDFDVVFSRSNA